MATNASVLNAETWLESRKHRVAGVRFADPLRNAMSSADGKLEVLVSSTVPGTAVLLQHALSIGGWRLFQQLVFWMGARMLSVTAQIPDKPWPTTDSCSERLQIQQVKPFLGLFQVATRQELGRRHRRLPNRGWADFENMWGLAFVVSFRFVSRPPVGRRCVA